MQWVVYFLVAIVATSLGAATGMGGGVIIKPVLDIMGHYNVKTIGMLSSITVLTMSLVSVAKHVVAKTKINVRLVLPLALGSVFGGWLGNEAFDLVAAGLPGPRVTVIQNIVLGILLVCSIAYMLAKHKVRPLGLKGIAPALLVGFLLGVISSFLGIGGGPINVSVVIFVFALDTKEATVCSLVTILFAQISKLGSVALLEGFAGYNLSMLPVMLIGAVVGGFIGAKLNKQLKTKTVEKLFNGVQALVLVICVYNIVANLQYAQ